MTDEACYVYGIVRADATMPVWEEQDLSGHEVELMAHGDVAALVEMTDPARTIGRRADLLAHSGVLNAVAAAGNPVIPVKFGSVIASRDGVVEELLAPNLERWLRVLDELRGLAQFTLRGRYSQDAVLAEVVREDPRVAELREQTVDQPEEASYAARVRLGELVAHAVDAKRSTDVDRIAEALAPHSASQRVTPGSGIDQLIDAAFLVDEDRREAFEAAAERLAEQMHERATLKLLGPLAPFDFVEEE
ncbi:MAG: GvpL/GvpF family gas vesicle protein [Nocardioidaceae bacterium]